LNLTATDGDNCETHPLSGRFAIKLAFQRAARQFAVVLAMAPVGVRAEDEPSMENRCELTVLKQRCQIALDIDHDGRMDRAVLVRHPTGPSADLSIYLAVGDEKIDQVYHRHACGLVGRETP
jgi:hypothetical protein